MFAKSRKRSYSQVVATVHAGIATIASAAQSDKSSFGPVAVGP